MQSPIIVFDHINKQVATIQPGPAADEKLAEAAACGQLATSGGARKP